LQISSCYMVKSLMRLEGVLILIVFLLILNLLANLFHISNIIIGYMFARISWSIWQTRSRMQSFGMEKIDGGWWC
jgi:hypothetical protein